MGGFCTLHVPLIVMEVGGLEVGVGKGGGGGGGDACDFSDSAIA